MNIKVKVFWGLVGAVLLWGGLGQVCSQKLPPFRGFPQHVTYASGTIIPSHVTRGQLDADTREMYDAWKSRYLVSMGVEANGHPRFRVEHGGSSTVSEGQGYGMILAVYLAGHDPEAQTVFDGLWEFALDHPSVYDGRLMDWFTNGDESPDSVGDDSAFDGDCDMAYALLLAEEQWGNDGRFHYGAEAARVLDGVLQSTIGWQSKLPLLGDWVDPNGNIYNQWTPRSSDIMPDHFRVFSEATGNPVWTSVLTASRSLVGQMQSDFSPVAGLLPDFLVPQQAGSIPLQPAPAQFLEGNDDGRFDYNACRDPWRLGTHALVTGDATALAQVRLTAQWIYAATDGNPNAVMAGYNLDGSVQPDADYFTTAFAAPMAVACMTVPQQQSYLNGLYDAVHDSHEDYYEDSIATLCMLVLSGNWWTPGDDQSSAVVPALVQSFLAPPHPNPFNPSTTINFSMAHSGMVSLQLYDMRGRLVRRLFAEQVGKGLHSVVWDGCADDGSNVASGVYFLQMSAVDVLETVKVTLVE